MPSRAAVGWALLFAVPPAVGVAGYVSMLAGGGELVPIAVAAGGLVAIVVFTLVLGSQAVGTAESDAQRGRLD